MSSADEKFQAVLRRIDARFGEHTLHRLSSTSVPHLQTGTPVDDLLGIGGLPRGHLTELHGAPTSGVTSFAYQVLAATQYLGQRPAFIDLARCFDPESAEQADVALDRLPLLHPPDLAHGLDTARDLLLAQAAEVLILDPNDEMPAPAALDALLALLRRAQASLIWLSLEASPPIIGEKAAVRLHFQRTDWLYTQDRLTGYRTCISVVKNKFAAGQPSTKLDIYLPEAQ